MSASGIIGAESSFSASHVSLTKTLFLPLSATHTINENTPYTLTANHNVLLKTATFNFTASHRTEGKSPLLLTGSHAVLPKSVRLNLTARHNTEEYSTNELQLTAEHTLYSNTLNLQAYNRIDPNTTYFTAEHTSILNAVAADSEISSSLAVAPPITEALKGAISVTETNTMDGISFIWGVRDTDLNTKVKVKRTEGIYLKSQIAVRESNTMDGAVDIFGRGETEIKSSIFAMGVSESYIDGRIGVRLRNSMTGNTDIWGTDNSDLSANVNVKQVSDLPMTLGVTPANKMTAIVDIQQPTRVTDTLTAKRDAFVRQAYPKLNYGGEQTLVTGYSATREEVFRSIVGFDIINLIGLTNDYKIEKVVMKLKHSIGRTPNIPIELSAVNGAWTEFGITWNNQPDSGDIVSQGNYVVNAEKGFIEFNITNFILQAKEQGKNLVDFYLRAVNESDESVQFFSMDAGASLAPTIEYTYFDEVIRSTGRSGIDTSILITYPAKKDLTSKINVFKNSDKKELPSTITVTPSGKRFENYPSSVMISRPDLYGKGTVRINTWSEIDSKVSVREVDLYDLENCSIVISRPNFNSELYVANRKDTPSQLSVRVWSEDNLYGWAIITVKERPAQVYVRPYVNLGGSVTVRHSVDEDLFGTFTVSERNKPGTIYVLNRDDLPSQVIARGGENSDIVSSITANQFQFQGTIEVNPYIDYKGSVSVRRSSLVEKESSITVSRPDLNSSVYVRFRSDLDGVIKARRKGKSDLDGRAAVSRPDLQGRIFPIIHSDTVGSITVRQNKVANLNSKINVAYRKDIIAEIDVVGASMIPSSIQVNSGYLSSRLEIPAYGNEDLDSEFIVRVRLASDIDSSIDVYSFSTIEGNVIVRQTYDKSVDSSITVRRTEGKDLAGSIDVWVVKDLKGKISIRRAEHSEIDSSMSILWHNDLAGSVIIPSHADLNSRINVMYPAQSEILSKVLAKIRVHSDVESSIDVAKGGAGDLLSFLGVTPTNKMTGIVDITLPIREEVTLDVIKDTYVREDVPTLNYGEETTFAVGSYKDKVLRSLLGFDISSLKRSYDIDKVELRMVYGQEPDKNLKLYAVDGSWSEMGVTWNNRPRIGTEITSAYTVDTEDGHVAFDVTDFIEEQYQEGNNLVDFYLVAADESENDYEYFFTKEASLAPQLVVTYFDPAVWSFGRSNIDSSIRVPKHNDKASRLRVRKPAWLDVEIPATIEVTRNNEFSGAITVSRPDLDSSVHIMHRNNHDVPSSLRVSNKALTKIDGSLTVSRPEIPVSFYVKDRVDLPSKIGVRVEIEQDFFSWLVVNAKERPATIFVKPHNDIELRFTVRGYVDEDMEAKIAVSQPEFSGGVTVQPSEDADLLANVTIRHSGDEDIDGSIKVNVGINKDFYSEVTVIGKADSDLIVSLQVVGYYLGGSLFVPLASDIAAQLRVAPTWFDYLPSSVAVSRPDAPSSLEVTLPADINATITVKVVGENDVAASTAVSRPETPASVVVTKPADLESSIGVRVESESSFEGGLVVSRPHITGSLDVVANKDLPSSVAVMHSADGDLNSRTYVKYMSDILGSLDVVGASVIPSTIRIISGNLASVIAVPAYDSKDLKGTIGVRTRFISEIPSTLQVQEWSQFVGKIGVRVWANHDTAGTLKVIVKADSDLASTISPVFFNVIPSKLGVRFDNTMTGNVDFIPVGDSDLDGHIDISPASDFAGSIQVVLNAEDDIPSSITVRARRESDLPANMDVIYRANEDLPTTLGVPPVNKMTGKVFIIPVDDSDLKSIIEIHEHVNLPSNITVSQFGHENLPSAIEVHHFLDVAGIISVRRTTPSDLPSKIVVRVWGKNDKSSKIVVRQRGYSNIRGSINTIQWKVLNSKIIVRRSAFSEIPMRFEVLEKSDLLDCSITVRRTDKSDLTSTITIRRSADKDLDGKIVARQTDKSDLPSFIETWQFRTVPSQLDILYRNDIVSTIDVVADYGYCFIM
ncbi:MULTISPECIES: DNRLRE domain-containing protein [Paenibacillus]|uniref:DNRLRE domain-containing protein n=1 Tax=Paenibacillus TaxID=44249 RepID=UPI000B884AB0|nr:DNRLRE domain-containing protein [Paenibacillus amylolyticus]